MTRVRMRLLVLGVCAAAILAAVVPAFAYDEAASMPEQHTGTGGVIRDCTPCHRTDATGQTCSMCHAQHVGAKLGAAAGKGPHGLYTAATNRCSACHDVHAGGGPMLLPGPTVTASCNTCHDGSGGKGVYGAIKQRGLSEAASHSVDTTNVVPGADASSGGASTMAFGGLGGTLGCDDCHSPHDANTVDPYYQERMRTTYTLIYGNDTKTNKLLRRNPGSSTTTATAYGSDWCLACHKGRSSGGTVHNHPVDATQTAAGAYGYSNVPILASEGWTDQTMMGGLARTNRGYLMPFPRTPEQDGHAPICQQCHEDTRFVGALSADGMSADAATFSVTATDGNVVTDNPRFQNFPHETVNARMTVETEDDLCTNCHPPAVLP